MLKNERVLWSGLIAVVACLGYVLWSHARLSQRLEVIEGQQQILLRIQAEQQKSAEAAPKLAVE